MDWSGTDLKRATETAGTLLEEFGLEAYLFAIEPRDAEWELKLECAVKEGWQMVALPVDVEVLLASRTHDDVRARLLRSWSARITSCVRGSDRQTTPEE
jgi:hypothetical protein